MLINILWLLIMINSDLRVSVEVIVNKYLADLDGEIPAGGIYDVIMAEAEYSLYKVVYESLGKNQSDATKALGISRATFRKKLQIFNLLSSRRLGLVGSGSVDLADFSSNHKKID